MANNRLNGRIDFSELKSLPEKHEEATARFFARLGKDIVFIRPSSIKGAKTPDFRMDGKAWETKSPIVFSNYSFENNFRKAVKQSPNIIFDLRRLRDCKDESRYYSELKRRSESSTVKNLLVIGRSGKLFTLKGKFDIM